MAEQPITIAGKDYAPSELTDVQQYYVQQIQDLQVQSAQMRFKLDQIETARQTYALSLQKSVEEKVDG